METTQTTFTVEESLFAIDFPHPPIYVVIPGRTNDGKALDTHSYFYESKGMNDDNYLYALTYIDYPVDSIHHSHYPLKVRYFLDTGANNFVQTIFDGQLAKILSTGNDQYAGRIFDVRCLDNMYLHRVHMLLVNQRLYFVQVVTGRNTPENKNLKDFITSFQIRHDDQLMATTQE